MFFIIIFALSGIILVVLITTKVLENKNKKSFFPLNFISKSDHRIRELSNKLAHHYSELKDKSIFFIQKQVPLHSKNILNKAEAMAKENLQKHLVNIRNSKLLKPKNEGISEFFKNLSEKENGNTTPESTNDEVEVDSNSQNL